MSQISQRSVLLAALLILVGAALAGAPAAAQPAPPAPATVNVLQDCWTTDVEADPDREKELYTFTTNHQIDFVWKHKLLEPCSSYSALLAIFRCIDGKPQVNRESPVLAAFDFLFGAIDNIPGEPEPLFSVALPPGTLPPGRYDWALITECNDTNAKVRNDQDIDDECGINMGRISFPLPVILGPEPIELWQPDPGGSPPGRGPGEEGTTRPWCFSVEEALPEVTCPCWTQQELDLLAKLPALSEVTCRASEDVPPIAYWSETGPAAQYLELAVGTLTETCKDCNRATFGYAEWQGSPQLRLVNLTDAEVEACVADVERLGQMRDHSCWAE